MGIENPTRVSGEMKASGPSKGYEEFFGFARKVERGHSGQYRVVRKALIGLDKLRKELENIADVFEGKQILNLGAPNFLRYIGFP